jgi:hypothetical protein
MFKTDFTLESYLLCTPNFKKRRDFTKLRISAHKLHIELGRHSRPKKPIEERICTRCNSGEVDDEKHFMLHCASFKQKRDELVASLDEFSIFSQLNEESQFELLMSYNKGDTEFVNPIVKFVSSCFDTLN